MSGPPAPSRRSRRPQQLVMGATTAVVMAATGAVILPPDTSAAQYSPRDVAAGSPYRADTMTYSRSPLSATISRDADRGPRQPQTKTRAQRQRAQHERVERRRAERQRAASKRRANRWVLPISNYSLSARFGEISWLWSSYHTGLDFSASYGTPIRSVAAGTVTEASYDGSYGYKTVVTLENGTELWYCHQASLAVGVGNLVDAAEVIGYVGTTGNVTGAHLHLEVRPNGRRPVNPFATLARHGLQPGAG